MGLFINITGITTEQPALTVKVRRSLGQYIHLTVYVRLNHNSTQWLDELTTTLLQKPVRMEVLWEGTAILPAITVESVNSLEENDPHVILSGRYHELTADCYTSRKRILKAAHLKELLERYFSSIVSWDNSVGGHLSEIVFPDKQQTNHLQDGINDVAMLYQLIGHCNRLSKDEEQMLLTGDAINGKLLLVWLQDAQYKNLYLTEKRQLRIEDPDKLAPRISFGGAGHRAPLVKEGGHDSLHIGYNYERGHFDSSRWENWRTASLPRFLEDKYVFETDDQLQQTGAHFLDWNCTLQVLPAGQTWVTPVPVSHATWAGYGTVTKRDKKQQWMTVALDDFEAGSRDADVRLSTPYGGKAGKSGLHLVPEEGSKVLVFKPADWMAPMVCTGNVRQAETGIEAPCWQLEDPLQLRFKEVTRELERMDTTASNAMQYKAQQFVVNGSEKIEWKTGGVTALIDNVQLQIS